jgi:hypothetical protein
VARLILRVTPHDVARLMYTVALEKVASDVAKGVTPHSLARLARESRHGAWRDWIDRLVGLGVPSLI